MAYVASSSQVAASSSSSSAVNWQKYHFNEYINYFLALIQGSRGSYKHREHGVHLLYTGDEMWNSILLHSITHELADNLGEEIASWLQFFYRHGSDHADVYFPSNIAYKDLLVSELEQRDFTFWSYTYGMELDITQPIDWMTDFSQSSSSLRIERVSLDERSKLDTFHKIVAENFLYGEEEPYRPSLIKMRRGALEEPYMLYFMAYHQDGPVATVTLSVKHSYLGVAQLSDVSTVEAHRRKGYAREIIKFACLEAKKLGYHTVTLQGERDGPMKLYRSLGFRESCQFDVWENMGS